MHNYSQLNFKSFTKNIFNKKFFWFGLAILSLEILSFFVFLFPSLANFIFIALMLVFLVVAYKNLKYGFLILLAELFIGSKGYLFYFEQDGIIISIRIALWLIIMSVCLAQYLLSWFKKRDRDKNIFNNFKLFNQSDLLLFLILFLFALWGFVNGIINHNDFSNVFFDFNSWLFILLVFPAYYVWLNYKNFKFDILQILILGSLWVSLKTLFFEFFFSYPGFMTAGVVYSWVRTSGVGEITVMDSGFVRIFFQSQIFVLISFFVALFIFNHFISAKNLSLFRAKYQEGRGEMLLWFSLLTVFIATIIVSLSRSFWLGSVIAFFFYLIIALRAYRWKNLFLTIGIVFTASLLALLLIALLIKFPYQQADDVNLSSALSSRVNSLNESAVSSRYNLWPKLTQAVGQNPLLGKGFGSTITYQSSDPRVRQQTVDGQYTTYAFEWGWLDIWLKLGLAGMLFLVYLLFVIMKRNLLQKNWLNYALAVSLLLLIVVNFFSPYLNHPLGLGFLIIASIFSQRDF